MTLVGWSLPLSRLPGMGQRVLPARTGAARASYNADALTTPFVPPNFAAAGASAGLQRTHFVTSVNCNLLQGGFVSPTLY
jgi:hypothetical protein